MAAKTPAAKKRKIVQENRIQGRISTLHFAFSCGCGVFPVRSCRWSSLICQCSDELKSRFAAVGHADFWRKHILPTKRFPGLGG